ncbi:hypothetical protein O2N63_01990 [Aliiroseovarius sp. KMU-50]|uniref:Uncharacterized protein n=1 Tax=Aliiroseovarius salicola TaxID=3009082 RepID=A0ABT4VZ45_9RHOB|nr:hypothetical protein [Aliiroseovarius sp. KMU-50]MDA5092852.1 hypothetical protein [Aliiroseovarius sp. KMU-50]
MAALSPHPWKTVEELETVLASAAIPSRIAQSCERLVERLRRPIRVGLIGFETRRRERLLAALLGEGILPDQTVWPTIEIAFSERPYTNATLADASTLAADGMPQAELFDREVVFLQIGAPIDALRRMTFLHVAASESAAEQSAALRWASRRIDFALWCTRDFSPVEAEIWGKAVPELKNHAYLVAFASETETDGLRNRMPPDFGRVMFLPDGKTVRGSGDADMQSGAQRLFEQLATDIDDALKEDLDSVWMLLHRHGQGIDAPKPNPEPELIPSPIAAARTPHEDVDQPSIPGSAKMVELLSEPLIFLKRWSRDLFETLEWQDADSPDWADEVLESCRMITDGLRDRAEEWPEDEGQVLALRGLVDEASDMATLLQIEGGPDQALDAAALLLQLRSVFEANLAQPQTLLN